MILFSFLNGYVRPGEADGNFLLGQLLESFRLHHVKNPLAHFLFGVLGGEGDIVLSSACFSFTVLWWQYYECNIFCFPHLYLSGASQLSFKNCKKLSNFS